MQLGGDAFLTITGGTANLSGITVDSATGGQGTSELVISGGATVYLGGSTNPSGALIVNSPSATDYIHLGTATIGAASSWSTSAPITLQSGSTASFKTANSVVGTVPTNITLTGTLSGAGGLTTSGTGILLINGTNSYTGATNISSGATLQIGSTGALASSSGLTIASGGVLDLSGTTLSNALNLAIAGPGINSTGAMINSDTGVTATYSGGINETGSAAFGGSGNIILSGTIGGGHSITYAGTATLILTGAVNGAGSGMTIDPSGTVQIGNAGTLGTLGSGAITDNGTLAFDRTDGYGGAVVNTISGSGGLTVESGTLTLSSANTFTGQTIVTGGTLALTNAQALQDSTLNYNNQGGFLNFGTLSTATLGGLAGAQNLPTTDSSLTTLNLNLQPGVTGTYSGGISNNGATPLALTINGSATGAQVLSGSSNYTGQTTVSSGSLVAANNAALGSASSAGLVLDPSSGTVTVDFTSANPSIGSLASSGAGTSNIVLGNGVNNTGTTLTVGGNGTTTTFGGTISGQPNMMTSATGSLILAGGQLNFTGTGTYVGPTIVNSGTFNLNKGVLGNTAVTVKSGATLTGVGNFSTTGLIGGTLQAPEAALITLVDPTQAGLSVTGGITLGDPEQYLRHSQLLRHDQLHSWLGHSRATRYRGRPDPEYRGRLYRYYESPYAGHVHPFKLRRRPGRRQRNDCGLFSEQRDRRRRFGERRAEYADTFRYQQRNNPRVGGWGRADSGCGFL